MQDIVRSLANMENTLLEIGAKVEMLRSQIRSLTESGHKGQASGQSSHPSGQKDVSRAAERSQRKTSYGSPYRQDGVASRTTVSSTQDGIQESWSVGDGSQSIHDSVMMSDTSLSDTLGYHSSSKAYARQSEYSIYARP